ncbi:binding protein [[Candida] boidinii]|nr:binding protein [[Candida] boidinii]
MNTEFQLNNTSKKGDSENKVTSAQLKGKKTVWNPKTGYVKTTTQSIDRGVLEEDIVKSRSASDIIIPKKFVKSPTISLSGGRSFEKTGDNLDDKTKQPITQKANSLMSTGSVHNSPLSSDLTDNMFEFGLPLSEENEFITRFASDIGQRQDLPGHNEFLPDTSHSFNAPLTTFKDFSWIFEDFNFKEQKKGPENDHNEFNNNPEYHEKIKKKHSTISQTKHTVQSEKNSVYVYDNILTSRHFQSKFCFSERTRKRVIIYILESLYIEKISSQEHSNVNVLEPPMLRSNSDERTMSESDEFFQLETMNRLLLSFFTNVITVYPIIHLPSFDLDNTNSLLIVCMLVLGASYDTKENHKIAVRIHDLLRGRLFSSNFFGPIPELWVLDAILLIEIFGKFKAGVAQYEMSHLFHGLLINLIRRSGCENISISKSDFLHFENIQDSWEYWIKLESKKRLAFSTFIWDVQNSLLFGQTLCMSAFELRLQLPSSSDLWNAATADEWYEIFQKEEESNLLLSTLKKFLNVTDIPVNIDSYSRVIILHGLMGISCDMHRRDQMSLTSQNDPYVWKSKLVKAYDCWKENFDTFTSSISLEDFDSDVRYFVYFQYCVMNNCLYHSGQILLWCNAIDVQIYAGAKHILGRQITKPNIAVAKEEMYHWYSNLGYTEKCLMHASQLIREGLMNSTFEAVLEGTFHFPWCLYLATLVCWSFYNIQGDLQNSLLSTKKSNQDKKRKTWIDNESYSSMKDLILSITSMAPSQYRSMTSVDVSGLLYEVRSQLKTVRWGLTYEAQLVLKSLSQR